MDPQARVADTAVATGVGAWFLSHLGIINGLMQFLVLAGTLVGLYFAARYHHRNTPK